MARTAFAALLGLWTVFPLGVGLGERTVAGAIVGLHLASGNRSAGRGRLRLGVAGALGSALAVALLRSTETTSRAIGHVVRDDRVLVVVAGAVAAVFVVGELIGWLTAPLSRQVAATVVNVEAGSLASGGRYIGWLERLFLYVAFLLGATQAVIIILTLKSIARLPSLGSEPFVEYFLIGTLLSLIGSIAVGVGVRVILGMSPL